MTIQTPTAQQIDRFLERVQDHAAMCLAHTAAGAPTALMLVPSTATTGTGSDLEIGDLVWRTHAYKGRTVMSRGVVASFSSKKVAYAAGPDGSGILAAPNEPVHYIRAAELAELIAADQDEHTAADTQ